MTSALHSAASKLDVLAARARPAPPRATQLAVLASYAPGDAEALDTSQLAALVACAPPSAQQSRTAQAQALVAFAVGEVNVAAEVSQAGMLIAYGTGVPNSTRSDSWTFVMDGHRFWVLPLGPEGDWAYDTVTKQWCKLYTQGFNGLNFTHGVMWGLRVVGSDLLYPVLYEMAASYPDDEGWRPVMHVVTGGIATRSPNMIGVANFRVTASVGALSDASTDVNLTFSDDNGVTWSDPFTITLAQGAQNQPLVWSALGSFAAPGRIFQISDQGGMLSIYGADASLNNYDEDDNEAANGRG
jgi:hypothetical protein